MRDMSIGTPTKRMKTDEYERSSFGCDDMRLDHSLLNSLQKTWEITVKTNRNLIPFTKTSDVLVEEIQEFSWQAYLEPPSKANRCLSATQKEYNFVSTDKTTQSFWFETTATSTQTLSEIRSDVSMQFPPFDCLTDKSLNFPAWKDSFSDTENITMVDRSC